MKQKDKLRFQLYIGVIIAIIGIVSFMFVSFLLAILILAIGFWLSYKAEQDLKK